MGRTMSEAAICSWRRYWLPVIPLLIILIVALSGCASYKRYGIEYSLPNGNGPAEPFPGHLVVRKFTDQRPESQKVAQSPLAGTKSGDSWFQGTLAEEIPKQFARDLQASRLYETVTYSGGGDGEARGPVYYLDGIIHSFEYADGVTARTHAIEVEVKLSIRLLDENNNVIWSSPVREGMRYPSFVSLHWNESQQKGMPYILEALAEAARDLKQDLFVQARKLSQPVTASVKAAQPPQAPAGKSRAFPREILRLNYPKAAQRPDDIAVIIGNADYSGQGRNIPDVLPAYADADSFRRYVIEGLGVREGNVIDLRDATQADFISVFGSESNPRGQLYNWTQAGISNITVYYAGHGAPTGRDGTPYLVPVNANPATLELNGYALATLFNNLSQIPAKSITIVLEACFSGVSQGGGVISQASPVFMRDKALDVPEELTVISAGSSSQMASWEEDSSHGLFTKYYLKGLSGEADGAPYGNGDGKVEWAELNRYLGRTVTYYARRYYGRDQTVQMAFP